MKSTRIKRPANRIPTSLAIATTIQTRVPPSSPNQLQTIDPQLLEYDAQLPNNKAIINTVEQADFALIEPTPLTDDIPSSIQT